MNGSWAVFGENASIASWSWGSHIYIGRSGNTWRTSIVRVHTRESHRRFLKDADEGLELLNALRDLLNQTWEARETIQPRSEERRTPRPLDVWELLPRTNCRAFGEVTCMAFGFALLETRRRLDEWPPLRETAAAGQYETLRGLLGNHESTFSVWRLSEQKRKSRRTFSVFRIQQRRDILKRRRRLYPRSGTAQAERVPVTRRG